MELACQRLEQAHCRGAPPRPTDWRLQAAVCTTRYIQRHPAPELDVHQL